MSTISEEIKKIVNMRSLDGVTSDEIAEAEKILNLTFAEDYREYLEKFGAATGKGVELTGLNVSKRINVVDVTVQERELNDIPNDMYVIENLGIESIIILQRSNGEIYQLNENGELIRKYDDLVEYLKSK